jgi:O-methyltransferase
MKHQSPFTAVTYFLAAVRLVLRACFARPRAQRLRARYHIVEELAWLAGVRTYKPTLYWISDKAFKRTWDSLRSDPNNWEHQRPQARRPPDSKYVLYSIAQYLRSLDGDTAECGVFRGDSSYLICHAAGETKDTIHHVFDSFAGLSHPAECDRPALPDVYQWSSGDLSASLETVSNNLSAFPFVRYYRGWIPDRFAEVADRRFRLVHIDVDLYQPTKDALEFFYPLLVPGGMIVCDDYGSLLCPGAKKAVDELIEARGLASAIHLSTGQAVLIHP